MASGWGQVSHCSIARNARWKWPKTGVVLTRKGIRGTRRFRKDWSSVVDGETM